MKLMGNSSFDSKKPHLRRYFNVSSEIFAVCEIVVDHAPGMWTPKKRIAAVAWGDTYSTSQGLER